MRKLLLTSLLSFSLAGCATPFGQRLEAIGSAISVGTASVANPVTPTRLNQMESAVTLVFAGLNTWRTACVRGTIPVSCKAQITGVQVYTRQIPPYLTQLRVFVKSNDQINAVSAFDSLAGLLTTIKSQAAASGVVIGG